MKKDVAEKWVAALRSGEFNQCKAMLKDGNRGHCCLGVLAEISGMPFEDTQPQLDYDVMMWAGMRTRGGEFPIELAPDSNSLYNSLWKLNDRNVMSFAQIADFIELNYEVL